jgi:hypothetical protein
MDDLSFNPIWIALAVVLAANIAASLCGWGWKPFAVLGGAFVLLVIVGVLTGLGILPDGVDIFTFLGGMIINIVVAVYMIVRRPVAASK